MSTIHFALFLIVSTIFISPIHTQECKHPVHFLMKTASGIDITKLDFFPIGGPSTLSIQDGFAENVFNFTCNSTWYDDALKARFDVPDGMEGSFHRLDPSVDLKSFSIFHSPLDAKKSGGKIIDQTYPNVHVEKLFTQSRKHQSLLKQYFASGKIFAQICIQTESVQFQLWHHYYESYSSVFKEFIEKKLPPKYEDNPALYQEFLQRFGTHIFDYGYFGFMHYLQFAIDQQYAIEHTDAQIERNVRVAFYRAFNISKVGGYDILEHESETAQVDADFAKHSELILSYGPKSSKWVDKVSGQTFMEDNINSDRVPLYIALSGMANVIYNHHIAEQVQIATKMYTIKAYLAELKNVYNCTSYQLSEQEKASLWQVETMLNANDTQNMNQMNEVIDQLYHNVSMFRDRKMCYPTLYDQYVTVNLKLDFAKQICDYRKFDKGHFTRQCPIERIVTLQKHINKLFSAYDTNEDHSLDCVKDVRRWSLEYGLLRDRDNGLKAVCTPCRFVE